MTFEEKVQSFKNILVTKEEGIITVTMNRPYAMNALNRETLEEFDKMLEFVKEEPTARILIITGQEWVHKEKKRSSFIAGADIKEFQERWTTESVDKRTAFGQGITKTLEALPIPVIASINGFALGGGCELAMACDIRIASEKAFIGQPEINLGIIPGYGGTQRLSRLVGKGKAKELVYTGMHISAQEAYRIGLVDRVVPHDQLKEETQKLAKELAQKSKLALKYAKEAIEEGLEKDLSEGLDIERAKFIECFQTEDAKEGIAAFIEKRKPDFKGR
ncbi:MAG: enoyl-CoA hydratase/isomerase family protein [Candidatus Hodarchaeota archaeon]